VDEIAFNILVIVGCLIPVTLILLTVVEKRRTGYMPEAMEVMEMLGALIVYGVAAWVFTTVIASLIYAYLNN
jgi:ABC-type nickel/cobalt efflux system permease component RcnA